MKVNISGDYTIYRGITSLATLSTFTSLLTLTLSFCVIRMSAIEQPFNQPSVSASERLETEKIISRDIWDSIFSQWSCNSTLCFKKHMEDSSASEMQSNINITGKIPWSSKRINHSEYTISKTESFHQNNYGRVFLTVSFLLFLSILTISIARECRQESTPAISNRGRPSGTRRRNNPRVRSLNNERGAQPLESIQIITDSRGGVLHTENIGIPTQQREFSLSYYYLEPRRMLWNSLYPPSTQIQIDTENENRNSTHSAIFHPDLQVASLYLTDCPPPTYQEISVHELPSYNEALAVVTNQTNLNCSEKIISVDDKSMTINVSEDDKTILNKDSIQ